MGDCQNKGKKKRVKVNELMEADVQFVSLVGSGANMIPLKVFKSEEGNMIHFDQLFKSDREAKPYVASVVVSKDENLDNVKKQLEANGFSTDKSEELENAVVFKQTEGEVKGEQVIYKLENADVAFHVADVKKGFNPMDFETASFKELHAKEGVLPNLAIAMDTLSAVMGNILFEKATDTTEASKMIAKAVREFGTVVTEMVENIPTSAFKMEQALKAEDQDEGEEESEDEDEAEEVEKSEKSEDESSEKEEVSKDEDKSDEKVEKSEDDEEESEDEGEAEGEEEVETEEVKKSEETQEADEKDTALEDILKAIEGLSSKVGELQKSQDENSVRIEEVSEVAKKAEEAVNGVTTATAQADREPMKKSDEKEAYEPLVIDTAYDKTF